MSKTMDFSPGTTVVVRWEANAAAAGTVKSNRINDIRVSKIVLAERCDSSGLRPKPGEVWVCRISRITNKKSETRGAIIVEPVSLQIDCRFEGVYVEPDKARLMSVVLQNRHKNLFLEGDQGVGKSTIGRAVAKELGWEFRKTSCGLIKKYIYMLGRYIPVADQDKLGFVWVDSPLSEVLREANSKREREFLLMLDEFTRMDEDARDALLDVIEGKMRELRLPNGDTIPVPPNVHFMAAGNVGGGFTVKREDAAAKDRWVIIKVSHMPPEAEIAHCRAMFPGCSQKDLETGIEVINALRRMRHDPKARLSKSVSTRAAENLAMFLSNGISLPLALETAVTNQFVGNADDATSEAGVVAKLIAEELNRKSSS